MGIQDLAQRLKKLLPRNDEERRIFTFALGAIYAASWAEALGYSDTTEPNAAELVDQARRPVLDGLAKGIRPHEGRWVAGFYFNDALFRTDVAFERLIRYVTRDYARVAAARDVLPLNLYDAWNPIHEEAIGLKHYPHRGRRTPHGELLMSLDALVCGLQWCFDQPQRTDKPIVRRWQHFGPS